MNKLKKDSTKKIIINIIISVVLSLLYSVSFAIIGPGVKNQLITVDGANIVSFFICFVISFAINFCIMSFGFKVVSAVSKGKASNFLDKISNCKLLFISWGVIFVSWIPAFLLLYPGVLSYDILSQTFSAWGVIGDNHHPVLHTWLIRVFLNLGENVFGKSEIGLGFLSLLQMLILSYALARLVVLLKKKKVPFIPVLATALLSALWFLNAVLSVTMVKDTLHAAFLVLFACHFTEIITDPKAYIHNKVNYVLLPITVFLMCATRNNGFHIYVFCIVLLGLIRIVKIKKIKAYIPLIVVLILPIILFKIYTGPIFDAWEIKPGQVREALCIPIQQLQRVAILHDTEFTDEQNEHMDLYLDNLKWMDPPQPRMYKAFFADPAKSCFYSGNYEKDPIAFWQFYVETGIRYPKDYVMAFLSNTLGYWYPGYYEYSVVEYDNYSADRFCKPLERIRLLNSNWLDNFYRSMCSKDFWRETPVIRFIFIPSFVLWILVYSFILSWNKKDYLSKSIPVMLPLIAQFGIMLLSPMSSFRYSWPFYLLLPLVLINIFGKNDLIDDDNSNKA